MVAANSKDYFYCGAVLDVWIECGDTV